MRIAYLTGRYPAVSHTFIAREVASLRDRGVDVHTFSIWAADPTDLPSKSDRDEATRTSAILPLRLWPTLRAHARAAASAPLPYLRAAIRAVLLGRPGLRGRALGAVWFVEAIVLWNALTERRIRHVHVHLNGTAPFVGLILTLFANGMNRGEAWSWSMSVHGPSEFYDVMGERLSAKVHSASLVICVSDFARSQLMAHVGERHWDKLRVIHCGVNPEEFAPAHRHTGPRLNIVTVARLSQVKGHAILLQALRLLRERGLPARLTIVGDGPKRDELQKLASDLGVAPVTVFAGPVAREEVRHYYAEADAFCLPSFAEGVPVVLMEAMATELPVVAADVMGVGELVQDGHSGLLVRPGRHDLLADALERLATDPALRRRLGAAGREAVLQAFDVRESAAQIEAAFRQTIQV